MPWLWCASDNGWQWSAAAMFVWALMGDVLHRMIEEAKEAIRMAEAVLTPALLKELEGMTEDQLRARLAKNLYEIERLKAEIRRVKGDG